MSTDAWLVRTPTEFRRTLGGHSYSFDILIDLPPSIEPRVRKTVEAIFNSDLELIDSSDSILVSGYLDSIEEPLRQLHEMGLAILAVGTSGKVKTGAGEIPNWRNVRYLIVPQGAYFRVGDELSELKVHKFDPHCEAAISDLLLASRKGTKVKLWFSAQAARVDYEESVPWCFTCCANESISLSE